MKKTEVQIAQEVMQGKWGVGTERQKKLKEAGYDPEQVQKYVNLMMQTKKPIKEITINSEEYAGAVIYVEVKQ